MQEITAFLKDSTFWFCLAILTKFLTPFVTFQKLVYFFVVSYLFQKTIIKPSRKCLKVSLQVYSEFTYPLRSDFQALKIFDSIRVMKVWTNYGEFGGKSQALWSSAKVIGFVRLLNHIVYNFLLRWLQNHSLNWNYFGEIISVFLQM